MLDPAIEFVLRGGLALLLLSTALHKARDFTAFRSAVIGYALAPERFAAAIAALLAGAEAAIGTALLAPASLGVRAPALVATALLLALYAAAIAVNLARGRRDIDCGCAGPAARQPLSEWLLARNAILVVAALVCLGGVAARPLAWVDAFTVSGGIAMAVATWLAAHRLLANAPALARLRQGA
jgi:hypothetical protein